MNSHRGTSRRRLSAPTQKSAAWIAARARNALGRPIFISTVSVLTFGVSLLALIVVPQQARKAAAVLRPAATQRPDTEPTVNALREAERQVARADTALVIARRDLKQLVAATAAATSIDTAVGGRVLSPDVRARRDSLTEQVALLGRLISRSENAPLLGSYRALALTPSLQSDARVKSLLDSLVEIERERDSYSAVGGVDPVFVALSARANELGRNIQALAVARRTAIKSDLSALVPPSPVLPTAITSSLPLPDTLAKTKDRDAARAAAAGVATRFARERAELLVLDAREQRASELGNVAASPSAMLAAALIFGAVLGFGAALFDEVRRPRVADGHEAERATGVRVLGEIRRLPQSLERGRRTVDRSGPSFLDPGADGHQLIYLTVATVGTSAVILTVTGDSPAISAIVAINFAAIATDEARETLLIDADGLSSTVSAALRIRPSAGISGLAKGLADWPQVIRSTHLGRDRTIDVVPTGEGVVPVDALVALLRRDAATLTKRYDAILVVGALDQVLSGLPVGMPVPDVLYCVRTGQTPIAELKHALQKIDQSGAKTRGIVMWNGPDPVLAQLRPAEEVELEAEAVA